MKNRRTFLSIAIVTMAVARRDRARPRARCEAERQRRPAACAPWCQGGPRSRLRWQRPRSQKLDLYLPEPAAGLVPLVVWVHGGGWQSNSKSNCLPALLLPARGYALASINYRLTDAGPFPIQIEDCRAAVRWLRANAAKYRVDPDKIGAWGPSAGGHLVALLGTAADEKEWDTVGQYVGVSTRLQAVCDYYGPTDFLAAIEAGVTDATDAKLLGGPPRKSLMWPKEPARSPTCPETIRPF